MASSKKIIVDKIKEELLNLDSPLAKIRRKNKTFPVLGEGSLGAKIMFIGEAPSKKESETGKPFCGSAGRVLSQMLDSVGLDREDVYITNIVNDRPPENRDPLVKEIAAYSPILNKLIDVVKPEILVTLGRFSMVYIMEKFGLQKSLEPIGKIHGKVFATEASYGKIKIIPLYHPAAALYQNKLKKDLFLDFKKVYEKN